MASNGHSETHAIWHLDQYWNILKRRDTSWLVTNLNSPNPQIHCTCPQALNVMKASLKKHQQHNMPSSSERLECRHLEPSSECPAFRQVILGAPLPPPRGRQPPEQNLSCRNGHEMQRFRNKHAKFMHVMNEYRKGLTPNGPLCLVFSLWLLILFTRGGELNHMHHFLSKTRPRIWSLRVSGLRTQLIKGSQRLVTVTVVMLSMEMIWNQPIEKEHLPILKYILYMSVYIYHHGDHVSQILPIPNIHQVHWSGISHDFPHLEWVFGYKKSFFSKKTTIPTIWFMT